MTAFEINARPSRVSIQVLSWLLFVTCIGFYLYSSRQRHLENPDDKVIPTLQQLADGFRQAALQPDSDEAAPANEAGGSVAQRFLDGMLWKDTVASGRRFIYAMLMLIPAVLLGLHMGVFPYVGALFIRFILFFDKIVALSVLPILLIAFGFEEKAKLMLIVIGVAPTIILDTFNLSKGVPKEQVVKAFSLGAGDITVAYRVILKQILPRILNSIRLNLKPIMLFLFAGEMIASENGLAYRIALLRRHMGMNIIIPYVLWVALLLFAVDLTLRWFNRRVHPWFRED